MFRPFMKNRIIKILYATLAALAKQTNKFIHQVCQLVFKKGALLTVVTESQRFDPFYVLL